MTETNTHGYINTERNLHTHITHTHCYKHVLDDALILNKPMFLHTHTHTHTTYRHTHANIDINTYTSTDSLYILIGTTLTVMVTHLFSLSQCFSLAGTTFIYRTAVSE